MLPPGDESLVKELAVYGAYHSDTMNQLVHVVFVPTILWSASIILASLSPASLARRHWAMNVSTPVIAAYAAYYVQLDRFRSVGVTAALFYLGLWYHANKLVQRERQALTLKTGTNEKPKENEPPARRGGVSVLTVGVVVQILSWVMQVSVGHGVYEGRKPALLDSPKQAFALAPLFVVFETFFWAGYRPELRDAVAALVAKQHQAWAQGA